MKTTKNSVSFLSLMLFLLSFAYGQKGGYSIYKTLEEYNTNQPSCNIQADSAKDKIRLYTLFPRPYIDVVKAGKKYRYYKDSIFAYRDADNKVYRFYRSRSRQYEISENKTLVIYFPDVPVSASSGKSVHFERLYFFSKELNGDIIPLTSLNLKKAYPDNLIFHDMIDVSFADGTPVAEFDSVHKTYRVNELINKSLATKY